MLPMCIIAMFSDVNDAISYENELLKFIHPLYILYANLY